MKAVETTHRHPVVINGAIREVAERIVKRMDHFTSDKRPMSQQIADARLSDYDDAQRILELQTELDESLTVFMFAASIAMVKK